MPVTGIPDVSPSRGTVLSIYALAYFASFGNPLVMPLLPFIAAEFSLSPLELGLMISMYALPGACVIPVFGGGIRGWCSGGPVRGWPLRRWKRCIIRW